MIDRDAPGLAELMRAVGLAHTPHAALSRAVRWHLEHRILFYANKTVIFD